MHHAFFDSANADQQRNWRGLVQLLFISLILLAIPTAGFAQNGAIKMTLGDHKPTPPHLEHSRLADYQEPASPPSKRAVLASATCVITQESDFEPATQVMPKRDSQALDLPGTTEPRSVLPNVQDPESQNPNPLNVRKTDEPIDQPTLNLTEQDPENASRPLDPKLESSIQTPGRTPDISFNDEPTKRDYALPSIASVREPISMMPISGIGQSDPSNLLSQNKNFNLDQRNIVRETSYAELSGTQAQPKSKTWKPHNFYHRPLYFEEPNVERQGNRRAFQNVASTIHFFGTIPKLPLMIGKTHPNQRIYTHGNGRPGDCTDYRIVRPSHHRKDHSIETVITPGF